MLWLRFSLGFLLIIGTGFYFFVDRLLEDVESQYLQAAEEPMVDMAHLFAAQAEAAFAQTGSLMPELLQDAFEGARKRAFSAQVYDMRKTGIDTHAYIAGADGIVLYDSNGGRSEGKDLSEFNDIMRTLGGRYGARSTRDNPADDRSSVMYVGAPIYAPDGTIVGVVSVARPQATMFFFMDQTKRRIGQAGKIAAAGAIVAGILFSLLLTIPARRLTDYARAVKRGERVAPPKLGWLSGGEMRTLGVAFEEMRDELEGKNYAERYVQALTHELKSPLAAIRGASELLDEGMPARTPDPIPRQHPQGSRPLRGHHRAAPPPLEVESRKSLGDAAEPVDLREVAREAIAAAAPRLQKRGQRIDADLGTEAATLSGDAMLLRMAVDNLIQNAIDFSPPGGAIRVAIKRGTGSGGEIALSVEDCGPGLPEYAVARAFERFYSLKHQSTGKKGSGLGLCFVRETAALHGGTASIENRSAGGARASMTLPAGGRDR
ncbi:MAG: two-component system sensor histidine kinase CreC [Verrucomicrobiales bacterium]